LEEPRRQKGDGEIGERVKFQTGGSSSLKKRGQGFHPVKGSLPLIRAITWKKGGENVGKSRDNQEGEKQCQKNGASSDLAKKKVVH